MVRGNKVLLLLLIVLDGSGIISFLNKLNLNAYDMFSSSRNGTRSASIYGPG